MRASRISGLYDPRGYGEVKAVGASAYDPNDIRLIRSDHTGFVYKGTYGAAGMTFALQRWSTTSNNRNNGAHKLTANTGVRVLPKVPTSITSMGTVNLLSGLVCTNAILTYTVKYSDGSYHTFYPDNDATSVSYPSDIQNGKLRITIDNPAIAVVDGHLVHGSPTKAAGTSNYGSTRVRLAWTEYGRTVETYINVNVSNLTGA